MGSARDNSIGRRAVETLSSLRRVHDRRAESKRRADELVDAYFDRELKPEDTRLFFESIQSNDNARRRFESTQRALDSLRTPVDAPDLSQSILAEVGRRRGWLPSRLRRYVTFGRVSIAACFLLMLTGAFIVERESPGALQLEEPEAPLTHLVQASRDEAAMGLNQFTSALESVRQSQSADAVQESESRAYTFCPVDEGERRRATIVAVDPPNKKSCGERVRVRVLMTGYWREGEAPSTLRLMMPQRDGESTIRGSIAPASLQGIDD